MTAIKICKRCEEEFKPKNCKQERCEKCEKYIVAQTLEAKTGRVTTRCGGSIPVWIAYRCLYCGEYFNQTEAEIHFGKTRTEHVKALARKIQMDPDKPGSHDPDTCECDECKKLRKGDRKRWNCSNCHKSLLGAKEKEEGSLSCPHCGRPIYSKKPII